MDLSMKIHAAIFVSVAFAQDAEVGSGACAGCHAEIFEKYRQTGMARSAGPVGAPGFREGFAEAAFSDPGSGAHYRVEPDYRLSFARMGAEGQRMLSWFIGSGRVGRSYLFGQDGFLFQAPVAYYAESQKWDLSPGYQRKRTIELTRGVETGCLQCHTSRMQTVAGTTNRFSAVPFLEGGVSCERCHGGGRAHVQRVGAKVRPAAGAIVNPAKLEAARRDSVCAQCHLTGAARVAKAGQRRYQAGDRLSDSLAVSCKKTLYERCGGDRAGGQRLCGVSSAEPADAVSGSPGLYRPFDCAAAWGDGALAPGAAARRLLEESG